jgi:formylglycine-generating enzyme required for sulfatase activity
MGQVKTEMVLIAGGTFIMGSEEGNSNERPAHEVEVANFYMDRQVITNREFQSFIIANPEWQKANVSRERADQDYLKIWEGNDFSAGRGDYSVINVSWYAAAAYAAWLGKRLPTEAEWEYAAGSREHYKWSLGNTFESEFYAFGVSTDPVGFPVKSCPPNSYGLYEMSGGVWEWVQDSYEVDAYQRSARINPLNQSPTPRKALRGGSCLFDNPSYLRCSVRGSNIPNACHEDYGFRCAADCD